MLLVYNVVEDSLILYVAVLFDKGSVVLEEGETCLEMCLLLSGRCARCSSEEYQV